MIPWSALIPVKASRRENWAKVWFIVRHQLSIIINYRSKAATNWITQLKHKWIIMKKNVPQADIRSWILSPCPLQKRSIIRITTSIKTEEARKKRKANDKIAQMKRYNALSPNTKKQKNQKKNENRRLRKARKNSKPNVNVDVVSMDDINPIIEEPQTSSKLSEYEKIRERNIAERTNLFKKLKLDELKEASKPFKKWQILFCKFLKLIHAS